VTEHPTNESGRSEVAYLARRVWRQEGVPDGLDAEVLARGYLDLEKENERLNKIIDAMAMGPVRELAKKYGVEWPES
jgi:hypothetical protein